MKRMQAHGHDAAMKLIVGMHFPVHVFVHGAHEQLVECKDWLDAYYEIDLALDDLGKKGATALVDIWGVLVPVVIEAPDEAQDEPTYMWEVSQLPPPPKK